MAVRSKTFSDQDAASAGWHEIRPTQFEVAQPTFYDIDKQKVVYQCGDAATRIEYSHDMLARSASDIPLQSNELVRRVHELTSVPSATAGVAYSNGELSKLPCGPWSLSFSPPTAPDRVTNVVYDLAADLQPSTEPAIVPSGFTAATPRDLLNRLGVPTNSLEAVVLVGGRLQGAKAQRDATAEVLEFWRGKVQKGMGDLEGLQTELQRVVASLNAYRNRGHLIPQGLLAEQARLEAEITSAKETLAPALLSQRDARAAYDAARIAYEVLLRGSMR